MHDPPRWYGYPEPVRNGRPTPYKVLADEINNCRHPYRVFPFGDVGAPCCDCTGQPDDRVHRDLSYLLYEAGLRSAEQVFNPAAGYWDPLDAQAVYRGRIQEKVARAEANRAVKEEAGATPWTAQRTKKSSPA